MPKSRAARSEYLKLAKVQKWLNKEILTRKAYVVIQLLQY